MTKVQREFYWAHSAISRVPTADPGVMSSIPARSHTSMEMDHEIISAFIKLLPLIPSRGAVFIFKQKYVHEVLVNRLVKFAQEKEWLGELAIWT